MQSVEGVSGSSLHFPPSLTCPLQELFCVCGALKRARLVHPGVAEVVFVKKDDAITAYKKYNNRCLDGRLGGGCHHAPLCFKAVSFWGKLSSEIGTETSWGITVLGLHVLGRSG